MLKQYPCLIEWLFSFNTERFFCEFRPKYVPDRQFQHVSDLPAPLGYTEHRVQHVRR